MKVLSTLVAISMISSAAFADDNQNFPFQSQAFQFRLNQGFFKAGGELLEEILKASGFVDKKNMIKFVDKKTGEVDFLQYRQMRSAIRLEQDTIVGDLAIDIAQSRFGVKKVSDTCVIGISGALAFQTRIALQANGSVGVDLPEDRFDASRMQLGIQGCGFFAGMAIRMMIRSQLQQTLQEAISKVANDQELNVIAPADVGNALKAANVFINVPSRGPLDSKKAQSQFDIDLGIHGYLSNARDNFERISISNPRKAYMNQIGLQWSLDAGVQANSRNVYNPTYKAADKAPSNGKFPEWGLVPYKKTGSAIDFDTGLMIRTSFLKTMFEKLYQAGFFNLQVQDSLLNKKLISLDPNLLNTDLKLVLPNGQALTKDMYADSRLELRLAAPPVLTVRNDKEFQLTVSDFNLSYYVKTKDNVTKEFEVAKMRAKFNLVTKIGMDEDARLAFTFNDKPVQEFQVISRTGVDSTVQDGQLEETLNKAVIGLLNKSSVDIPFLKGRKIEIKSLGIDGDKGSDQALSLYLKIKNAK